MEGDRTSDRATIWMLLVVIGAVMVATVVASCDARERHRAEVAAARHREGVDTKLEDLRERIDAQQDMMTAGLGLLGLMVAVGGLLLPVWTYVASIAPGQRLADDAQRAIKEAREVVDGLEQRFANLTAEHRQRELERAIASLNADGLEQALALQHVVLNHGGQLSSKQIFDIADAARRAEDTLKLQLAGLLAHYASPYVTRLMVDLLQGEKARSFAHVALRHCEATGPDASQEVRLALKNFALVLPDGLTALLHYALTSAPKFLGELLDDSEWLDRFPKGTRLLALHALLANSRTVDRADAVRASALFSQFKGRHTVLIDTRNQHAESAPDSASQLRVFEDGVQVEIYPQFSQEFRDAVKEATGA